MKSFFVTCLSLLSLMICSCQKNQDLERYLPGTWEVSVTAHLKASVVGVSAEQTLDQGTWLITFEDDGYGEMVDKYDSRNSSEFTYHYRKNKGVIDYRMDGKDHRWIIDELTRDYFLFHSNEDSSIGNIISASSKLTYEGRKK